MAAKRYFYSDTISQFFTRSTQEIVGFLTSADAHDINKETSNSWNKEIGILKCALTAYSNREDVYFEYNIPRMGRYVDVIVLIDGIVFALEYKTSGQKFTRDALVQVWNYAIVTWDIYFRSSKDQSSWRHYQLRSGTNWQKNNKEINQEYQINTYRVLLIRARQGMVIVVPEGDSNVPSDETRKPEWYDGIYNYLKGIGINEI